MNSVVFNQSSMFPTISHSQIPLQQLQQMRDANFGHVINTQTHERMGTNLHVPCFQPFNITIPNNSVRRQHVLHTDLPHTTRLPTVKQEVLPYTDSFNDGQQNDATSAVFSALHQDPHYDAMNNSLSTNIATLSTSYWQPPHISHPHYQRTQSSNVQRQCPRSPLGELRLPTIKTSANVAANVMSEESDLGYCSFSDMSTLQEISDAISFSDGSDDMFDDVQSNFSDIIDDVLVNMVGNDLIKAESAPPLPEVTVTTLLTVTDIEQHSKPTPPQPIHNNDQCDKHMLGVHRADHCEQMILPVPVFSGYVPYMMHPNSYTNYGISQARVDSYCKLCDKFFQSKSALRVHMRQHRGERPHQCLHCQKSFTQKSTLRTHIRTHTGERPYSCQYCARAFSDYSTYRKHLRVHTGEKPYTCHVCNKGFTQSGNMIRHREVHFKKSEQHVKQETSKYM